MSKVNKQKIFNDPIYGFVNISHSIIFDLIEHKYFQRLRHIKQTGFSSFVYPGANHSRFHHAIGCLHLMQKVIHVLRQKKVQITHEEEIAVSIAILLHDIGHGPFSHALEKTILEDVYHETISMKLMEILNQEFSGQLTMALEIFNKKYHKKFLSQLISSQIDIDRLDYLKRDSFYSGVSEGNINAERLITMMNVENNSLVIDAKGIYSVEKFLTSRVFMYWQVYLHKTSISAEIYLQQILKRARELLRLNYKLEGSKNLIYFLSKNNENYTKSDLDLFTQLDDHDLMYSLKIWQNSEDKILAYLSSSLILRKLPNSSIIKNKVSEEKLQEYKHEAEKLLEIENGSYFVHQTELKIQVYDQNQSTIFLKYKEGDLVALTDSEHQTMHPVLNQEIKKYHLCYLDKEKFIQFK
ncbi:MAG: HD domain-containing protein [Solirubrobacteraceae bacterium]